MIIPEILLYLQSHFENNYDYIRIMKKIFSVGNICLFLAAIVLTVVTAVIVNACGGDRLSCIMSSAFAGIIGTMAIGGVANIFHWEITEGPEPGIIATLVGMVLVLLLF